MIAVKRKYKLLFIHSSVELYGSDICLFELVSRLPKKYESLLVLPEEGPLANKFRDKNIRVIVIPLGVIRRRYIHPLRIFTYFYQFIYSIFKLAFIIKKENVDLVHTNVGVVVPGAIAAFLTHRPHIWHIREIFPSIGGITKLFMGFIDKFSQRVICISNTVKKQFEFSRKVVVVYDGINLDKWKRKHLENRVREEFNIKNQKVVGMIGRINIWKGQEYFINSANILRDYLGLIFFIVGDVYKGNEILKEKLVNLVNEFNLSDRIVFMGFREDIYNFLEVFDILVLSSISPEPFGIVLLEAMSMEIPIVATNHGGPREVVIDGKTGFLVPPKDSERMAEAISKLLDNEELRLKFGRAGRKRIEELFPIKNGVDKIVNIYEEVLALQRKIEAQ